MILRNLKSLIRRYPVAVVLNFTGLVAALLAFALIFLQADYELSFDKCHPPADRVFVAALMVVLVVTVALVVARSFSAATKNPVESIKAE